MKSFSNDQELFTFINECNNSVPIFRAIHNEQENSFVLDTWYFGSYDKIRFDHFMQLFLSELNNLQRQESFITFIQEPFQN